MHWSFLAFWCLAISLCCSSCLVIENQYKGIAPGPWRGVLHLDPKVPTKDKTKAPLKEITSIRFEEVANGELPFNFEVIYENDTTFYLELINGEERIPLRDIVYGHDRTNGDDTIFIDFPVYDAYFTGKYEQGVMQGDWVVRNSTNYRIPFVARHGQDHRFTNLRKPPTTDLSGKWAATFGPDGDTYPAIGQFSQNDNHLTGTFLTETGDYRFLEGTVQDDKFYLSTFDGAHAFLFEGKIIDQDHLIGTFRSGKHWKTTWEATRNPHAQLTHPDSLTFLKEGYETLDFAFENTEGQKISLTDTAYTGKVKLVQILGTWCPNCRDETSFLVDYFRNHPHPDVAVIGLAFEKYRDPKKAMAVLRRYKKAFGMDYELLLGGYADKTEAATALPMLNEIISYPTLLFLDKENKVRRIHTGFNGPATDVYADFKSDFEKTLQSLLAE